MNGAGNVSRTSVYMPPADGNIDASSPRQSAISTTTPIIRIFTPAANVPPAANTAPDSRNTAIVGDTSAIASPTTCPVDSRSSNDTFPPDSSKFGTMPHTARSSASCCSMFVSCIEVNVGVGQAIPSSGFRVRVTRIHRGMSGTSFDRRISQFKA
jgi:hypothetical protein